jgi:hypothetical protein
MMGAVSEIPFPLILRILATAAAALGVLAVCLFAFSGLPVLLRLRRSRRHAISLTNQGNVRSIYELVVESPQPALRFQLTQQGIPLAELAPEPEPERYLPSEPEPGPASNGRQPAGGQKRSGSNEKMAHPGQALQKVSKPARAAAGISGALGGMLGMVGSLIPGQVGQQIRAQGAALRKVQMKTTQTLQKPETGLRKVDELKKQGSRLGSTVGQTDSSKARAEVVQAQPRQQVQAQTPAPGKSTGAPARRILAAAPGYFGGQSAEVEPGETVQLDLNIKWKKLRLPESSLQYTVRSRQVPVGVPAREVPQPVVRQGTVFFGAAQAWRYWLFYLLSGFCVIAAVVGFASLYILIWAR